MLSFLLASYTREQIYLAIAIVGLTYVVYRIILQLRSNYQHIDEETLSDFWRGRLSKKSAKYRQVTNHLTYCEECRDKLDQVRKGTRPDVDKRMKRKF